MIGFDLLRPELVWWSLLAPLTALLAWRAVQRSRAELARWVAPARAQRFLPGVSHARHLSRGLLGALGLAFLALAAAGPLRGHTYRTVLRKGLDLVVCLDTSRSMLAQDLRPSRLERAKREVTGLLDVSRGDRVALIGFSGDARDVAPLTRDKATLEHLLSFVTPDDNQMGGTSLAAAIEHGLALFDGRSGAHEALVLLTDGEDLSGEGAAVAEEARKRNIRIYVVGIGTEAGGKIPIIGPDGREAFLRDDEGNEVVTHLDRPSLETLATGTGGAYLSASESPTPLEDLYRARISRLEGREQEGGERRVPYDRFQWPLVLGLACLVLELSVGARRPRSVRANRPRAAAALLPFALLVPQAEPGPEVSFARTLAGAVRQHAAGEFEPAEAALRTLVDQADALGLVETQRARVHYALGLITAGRALETESSEPPDPGVEAAREEDWGRALEAFGAARALAGPTELRLDATFDLGAVELARAEALRARIPEVSGVPAPPPPVALPPAGAPPTPSEPPPDPLPLARKRYQAAKGWYLERLKADWRDADTRADLELVQRRLHELDRIEEEREKQEQEDQQQQQDQQQDKQNPDDQEKEGDSDQQPPDDQQGDPEDSKPKDDASEDQPRDPQPQDETEESDPEPEESGEPEETEMPPPEGEPNPAPPAEPTERLLTREQVMQLLDKLAELEKEQQAMEAALRGKRRGTVKKDW